MVRTHLEYQGVVVPVLRYLNSLPDSKFINVHGSVFCERGTPDVLGVIRGRMVLFECKRDAKEAPEEIQVWRMHQWRQAGAVAECVHSVDQVREILRGEGVV